MHKLMLKLNYLRYVMYGLYIAQETNPGNDKNLNFYKSKEQKGSRPKDVKKQEKYDKLCI